MYLDSPAGVGMSYSLNKSDYATGDMKTAADAHTFLLKVIPSPVALIMIHPRIN